MKHIIVINPGATSTKVALYSDEAELFEETVRHDGNELGEFTTINDQLTYRYNCVINILEKNRVDFSTVNAIAARGGLLPPVPSGAFEVNDEMIDYLINRPRVNHVSNLGAIIADKVKSKCRPDTKAYVYDPVTVDEYEPISRISGIAEVERESIGHALNMRATAMYIADKMNQDYHSLNLVVAHLGGGNSISVHKKGRMIDSISDDEGPFSTERSGGLPVKSVIKLVDKYNRRTVEQMTRRTGGMTSYLGTNDAKLVGERIKEGDTQASLVLNALAYQVSKGIGSLATVVSGKVNGIIITGGLAYSSILTDRIKIATEFIAPVYIVPGEKEMLALASGVYRVLEGKEQAHIFKE